MALETAWHEPYHHSKTERTNLYRLNQRDTYRTKLPDQGINFFPMAQSYEEQSNLEILPEPAFEKKILSYLISDNLAAFHVTSENIFNK